MKAFEVLINGESTCIAGVGDSGTATVIVTYVGASRRHDLFLSVGGFTPAKHEHLGWVPHRKLRTGDEILVRIIESQFSDEPMERHNVDPNADIAEQKQYVREMAKKFGWTIATKKQR